MKNFTNNFKQITSRLSARWLIMALMMLVGTSSAWADGFFDGLKVGYYPGTGDNDIWTGYSTSDIGTLSGQPYLKGVSVKTWGDNVTSVSIEIKNGNTTLLSATNATKISEWNNGNQVNWNKEWELLTNIALPKTSGAHAISIIAKTNNGTTITYTLTYSIPCDNVDDSQIRIEIASATSYTKVYAWYDSNSELLGGWSGTKMTTNGTSLINGQTVKYITILRNSVSKEKSVNIIFNNGSGSQSGDISNLKWGNIYYFDKNGGNMESKCLEPACETPQASDFTYTAPQNLVYNNETKAATVVWNETQGGTIKVKYSSTSNKYTAATPKDAGTYYVFVSTVENDNYCAVTDLYINTFTIKQADQTALSISTAADVCGKSVTLATSGGTGTGSVTYSISGTNNIGASINGTTLSATSTGSVNVKATKSGGTNYKDAIVEKTFNFTMPIENVKLAVKNTSVKASYCKDENITLVLTYDGPTPDFNNNEFEWVLSGIQTGTQFIGDGTNGINSGSEFTLQLGGVGVNKVGVKLKGCNGWVTSTDENSVNITVNARPSAPSLSNPEAIICYGTTFTLPEKDDDKKTIKWVGVDDRELTGLTVGDHTYSAKIVENGCESTTVDYTITVKEQLAKPDLAVTNVKQCGSNYTEGKIVISKHNPNNTYILKKDGDTIDKTYNNGYSLSENEIGTYTVEVSKDNACGATSDDVTIEVINNTPTVTPFEITKQANVCMGNPVTLSYDGTAQSGTISYAWYEGDSDVVLGTEATLTIQQAKNATYKLVVTVTSNDCPASAEATTTVEPKAVPSAPTFDNNEMDACVNQQFTLPMPNNLKYEEEPLWTVEGQPTTASQTINVAGNYTYTAYKNDGCPSQGTPFTVRVNPLPNITSISASNDKPVPFEDVVLTADGVTSGAEVKWYLGNDVTPVATGTTYTVTSETAGEVIVKAKAFLNGCESAEVSKKVTFGAEDCGDIGSNNSIIITCDPGTYAGDLYCYIFGATTPKGWSDCKGTKTNGIWKWEFNNINEGDHSLIFHSNSKSNGKDCKTGDLNHKLQRGYQYDYALNGVNSKWCNEPHPTIDPVSGKKLQTITAPAVKTVSATSVEGSGVVNFTGQIIKTGCAATSSIYYGYQFKKVGEAWPTTGVEASNTPVEGKLIPLTNPSETALHYEFSSGDITLDDGNYVFRAYIINGYNFTNGNYDQGVYYGLDKLVTVSTVKAPVTKATIKLTESDGTPVDDKEKKYCVGETAYIMVDSDVRYTEISWKSQQGVDIVQTRLMNMYQFVVKGNDNIVVLLSNKYNVTPAESNTIEVYTFADPVLPTVSLNKVSICSNAAEGATVKLTNVVKGQTYQLYQQIDNGDGTFTENAIGSAKKQTEEVTDKTELVLHTLTKTAATGKYFVKTYTEQCTKNMAATQPFTFTVVDAAEVFISIDPASAETIPWMPAKFTVNASDKYTLNVTKGNPAEAATEAEVSQNGNKVSVKIPLPEGSTLPEGTTGVYGQYENVVFPGGATTQYTITATLSTTGGDDNPCATPANATITLVPYEEECTKEH